MKKEYLLKDIVGAKERKLIAAAVALTEIKMRIIMEAINLWENEWKNVSQQNLKEDALIKFLLKKTRDIGDESFVMVLKGVKADRDIAYQKVLRRLLNSLKTELKKNPQEYSISEEK